MLATNCVVCGRALLDAVSVELGIGPECGEPIHNAYKSGLISDEQGKANRLVHKAAIAAQNGKIATVVDIAADIAALGFAELAEKVARRFQAVVANPGRRAKISIKIDGDSMIVKTPFKRGNKDAFIAAWRSLPGRRYDRAAGANRVPLSSKAALWSLLKEFFGGVYGMGPKGLFRVPA
jgi:hypothetical protein